MKLYRCYNCENEKGTLGKDFEAESPKCPYCTLDTTVDTRFKDKIQLLSLHHFDPPHPVVKNAGTNMPACGAPRVDSADGSTVMMTGIPNLVNCPACKRTQQWISSTESVALNPQFDFKVELDPKTLTLKKAEE